ncbi:MAG: DUF1801 domain-containing protein [bacterium]
MQSKQTFTTIDEYIVLFPENIQKLLKKMRSVIHKAAPKAEEAIAYQMPTFKLNGNLVHFAAFKNHIGFFPTPSGIEPFKKELNDFVTSKGTIQFPYDKPIPYDLVTKIVKHRVEENEKKANLTLS